MSLYLGTQLLAGVATNTILNAHDLFDFKWTDHLLNDQSLLRADTFSWQDGTVYSNAYNHLVADYNGGTSQTETVGSYTITYVLATDGHKITTDETNVSNIYNESGVAWYYILDTTNQRFKLPRENPAREVLGQSVPVIGNGKTLQLTDGNNLFGLVTSNTNIVGTRTGTENQNVGYNGGSWMDGTGVYGLSTDSTKSGVIADLSETTGVYKGKQYLYFYVGQYNQSATEQTAGLNSELFNGKMDRDMSNMNASASAKQTIVGWGMPDYSAGVSLGEPSTYQIIPVDSFVRWSIDNTGTVSSAGIYVASPDESIELDFRVTTNYWCNMGVPVPAGWKVKGFAGGETITYYPMKGVPNS